MLSRPLIAACLVACTARTAPPAQPMRLGGPLASAPSAPTGPATPSDSRAPTAWVRFMPQSTHFCVRLPDGSLRATAYGVGGGNHFVLHEGNEVPHGERDALCTNYGITVLGARGQLGTTAGYHDRPYYTPEVIEPDARSLGRISVSRCYVDSAGAIHCINTNGTGAAEYAALLNKLGPIDHMVPTAPCAVYRDGQVACASENGPIVTMPMFTNAITASIVSLGWSRYAGCALLRTGKVACLGHNALALRSFTSTGESRVAVEIPGLERIDEVASSGHTACARRGGEVWCWGETAAGQAGSAALDASKAMPRCIVDADATKRAADAFEAAKRRCEQPRPAQRRDDPECRAMWQAIPPGTIFKKSATPCDPSQGASSSRWAPPTRVPDITDSVALGMNAGLSCALRGASTLTCWGNSAPALKSITFPARTLVDEKMPVGPVAAPRALSIAVGLTDVVVTSSSGAKTRHARGVKLGVGTAVDATVIDELDERGCTLSSTGITCKPPANTEAPVFPEDVTGAVRLSLVWGLGCVLLRDGVLRCGNATTREHGAQSMAARIAAHAPIIEHGGSFARYLDGSVGMLDRSTNPMHVAIKWRGATGLAVGGSGQAACVVLASGDVECTGENRFFHRGDEKDGDATTAVAGIPRATAVASSGLHACALGTDGTVWCWGRATDGELGPAGAKAATSPGRDPIYPDSKGPSKRLSRATQIPGITDAIAIGVGSGMSCALLQSSELACWGGGSPAIRRVSTTK